MIGNRGTDKCHNMVFASGWRKTTPRSYSSSCYLRSISALIWTCCSFFSPGSFGYVMITERKFISSQQSISMPNKFDNEAIKSAEISRRDAILQKFRYIMTPFAVGSIIASNQPDAVMAAPKQNSNADGNLGDLTPEALRSYLQYRMQLQTSADFYVFELLDKLRDTSNWGDVNELYAGSPNRLEREFTNIFRIIGLSMPPEEADVMREAQYEFERSIRSLSKVTGGIRRDLPIEIDKDAVNNALISWDSGRIAINNFFTALNSVTGLNEMKVIPVAGPNQISDYGRSPKRYVELKKKIKLCQNRGGPTLSNAWGTLMVSGYLQDSCGIPDLESYFYQT